MHTHTRLYIFDLLYVLIVNVLAAKWVVQHLHLAEIRNTTLPNVTIALSLLLFFFYFFFIIGQTHVRQNETTFFSSVFVHLPFQVAIRLYSDSI